MVNDYDNVPHDQASMHALNSDENTKPKTWNYSVLENIEPLPSTNEMTASAVLQPSGGNQWRFEAGA